MRKYISYLVVFACLLCSPAFAFSHGSHASHSHSSGPYYGGGHHTNSHGGSYAGGHGSSHKGGHYTNSRTNNHYGHHK
jgi:hypothetical protein